MHKKLFSLALLALCASPACMPALADAPAPETSAAVTSAPVTSAAVTSAAEAPVLDAPVQQQEGSPQPEKQPAESAQPNQSQPDQSQPAGQQPSLQPAPDTAGAQTTPGDPQDQPPTGITHALPPLRELVTSPFGNRRMPGWLSRRGLVMRDHAGIDIRARMGWPVTAFKPGTVVRAGDNGAMGISVDIKQDDGMTARYGHMSKTLTKNGQRVEAGEPVGLVGCTGRTTGAHLHFGLLNAAGKAVDPLPYLHSADEVLRPDPADIPQVLDAQSCGPVQRGPNGRPVRLGEMLKKMDSYTPPPLPTWNQRP